MEFFEALKTSLFTSGYFALFVIITIGIIIGKLEIKGISLDLSAVIFVALVFGHFGIFVPDVFRHIGLIMFIYAIGIQAGPGFFESFRKQGFKMIVLASVVVIVAGLVTVFSIILFDLNPKISIGLFAGALTSTPGLAAAIESTQSNLASIGYGIAYPFGVIGVILFMNLSPRICKIRISCEEKNFEDETKEAHPELIPRHFRVENTNVNGKTIGELQIRTMTDAVVSRVQASDIAFIPDANTTLHKGNLIRAVGTEKALEKVELLIGPVVDDDLPLNKEAQVQWLFVTNKSVVNKTIGQLNLFAAYGATITRIRRSGIDITPRPGIHLRFGDKLLIACSGNMKAVKKIVGDESKKMKETDFLSIAAGVVLGILIGIIPIPLGDIDFKFGLTGGVLMSGLILSRLGKTGPVIWNISGPVNTFLKQFGLLLFLASVGTNAGATLVETISSYGTTLFLTGVAITLIPMIAAAMVGHFVYKINFLSMLGVLTGGMTSTPGLTAVNSLTKSDAPNIAYATVYPIAMVILILCTQILGRIF